MSEFVCEFEKKVLEELQIYAEKRCKSDILSLLISSNTAYHVSIIVDSMDLFVSSLAFAHYIFRNARRALKILDDSFQSVALKVSTQQILKSKRAPEKTLHVRLVDLPNLPELHRLNLPSCSDAGSFLCISGTVIRTASAKVLQHKKLWQCSKCKYQFVVEADIEHGYTCEKPLACLNPELCSGKKFISISTDVNSKWCKDYQEIKIQEQVYNLKVGCVPRTMWVILENDLVDCCYPGNDVIVSGVVIQQWKPLIKDHPIDITLVILAHNVEVQNSVSSKALSKEEVQEFVQFWKDFKVNPFLGRDFILASICPQVFGLYIVKLAVALILAGGVQKKDGNCRIRGDSHLLLIGDPGTSKSQFLKFACKVSPRSVITSGIGTTNAGLTVSAIKDSGRWQLEAGALVLADGGICCIDEFSCMKKQDMTSIHEAMEQQTISVAKAGLVCSLNTRCSVLAATNPKGKYDENMSISENTALATPLLSRFDIIMILLDTYDEKWDEMVSSYILEGRTFNREGKLWSVKKLRNYFSVVRCINPKITLEAKRLIEAYYVKQRSLKSINASRTTPRLLQSLIRLAEGHARLMFRSEVLLCDAIISIILLESSMTQNSILELSPLHVVFPDDPNVEYQKQANTILQNLCMDLPVNENYEKFYEESYIKVLLKDISSRWYSKDHPFIFSNSQNTQQPSVTPFKKGDIDNSESTSNVSYNSNSDINESHTIKDINNIFSPEFQDKTRDVENILIKDIDYSNTNSIHNQVPEFQNETRDVENILITDIDYSNTNSIHNQVQNISAKKHCKGLFRNEALEGVSYAKALPISEERLLISNQELNSTKLVESATKTYVHTNREFNEKISTVSDLQNIFGENTNVLSELLCEESYSNDNQTNNSKSLPSQENISILEELVLSPAKDNVQRIDRTNDAGNNLLLQNNSSRSIFFPQKRSLADQLRNFTFSKSQKNSIGCTSNNPKMESTLVHSDKKLADNKPNKPESVDVKCARDQMFTENCVSSAENMCLLNSKQISENKFPQGSNKKKISQNLMTFMYTKKSKQENI